MSGVDVSAIIVDYNAGPDLRDALQSLADELRDVRWEVVVVDNASSDGSAAFVSEFPAARLIHNDRNVGFARGVNQGLAATAAPLVLIMNPDCRLMPGAFAVLRQALEAHADCAIVGPRILDPDGASQGSARGDPDMLTGLFGRTARLRRAMPGLAVSRRNVVLEEAEHQDSIIVDWISGACMLARRDALNRVHKFDERYFLYWEDADLCRRLRGEGYHVRYVPGATAVHRVGQSSKTARAAALRAFHDSAYLYYATYVAPGPLNPKRLIARVLLSLRCWWMLQRADGY